MFYDIHGVGDGRFGGLSAERFVALAQRTPAYAGVMQARVLEQQEAGDSSGPPAAGDDVEAGIVMEAAG